MHYQAGGAVRPLSSQQAPHRIPEKTAKTTQINTHTCRVYSISQFFIIVLGEEDTSNLGHSQIRLS